MSETKTTEEILDDHADCIDDHADYIEENSARLDSIDENAATEDDLSAVRSLAESNERRLITIEESLAGLMKAAREEPVARWMTEEENVQTWGDSTHGWACFSHVPGDGWRNNFFANQDAESVCVRAGCTTPRPPRPQVVNADAMGQPTEPAPEFDVQDTCTLRDLIVELLGIHRNVLANYERSGVSRDLLDEQGEFIEELEGALKQSDENEARRIEDAPEFDAWAIRREDEEWIATIEAGLRRKYSNTQLYQMMDADPALREALRRLGEHEADLRDAAGGLMVDLPKPGTEAAKMLRANRLLMHERNVLKEHLAAAESGAVEWAEKCDALKSQLARQTEGADLEPLPEAPTFNMTDYNSLLQNHLTEITRIAEDRGRVIERLTTEKDGSHE